MAKKILLVDVSHLFFRAFYAFPKTLKDSDKNPINAVFGVAQMLFSAIERHSPDYIFGGKDLGKKTFRSEKLESYKANRAELDEDLRVQIPRVYDFFDALNIPLFDAQGYEADDIIGTIAEKFRGNSDYEVEILTGDADSFQLIGDNIFVLKPSKGGEEKFSREVLFEKKNFYPEEVVDFKGLAGDSSDNLKGVVGIGEKGAVNLIRSHGNLESIFSALDEEKISGALAKKLVNGKDDAFFTREIATILCDIPIENFSLEQGHIENFSLEEILQFFQSIGSNSLQNRVISVFGKTAPDPKRSVQKKEKKTISPQESLF